MKHKFILILFANFIILLGLSCDKVYADNQNNMQLQTVAIHRPIYPKSTDSVELILNIIAGNKIERVELYVSTKTIDQYENTIETTSIQLLKTWMNPTDTIVYKNPGFGANKLITYSFKVFYNGISYSKTVSFATNPYPAINSPVPIYVVGNKDSVMNCVFMADFDMEKKIDTFYKYSGKCIENAFQSEPTLKQFHYAFNYFINPFPANAQGIDEETRMPIRIIAPVNDSLLKFAIIKIILHETKFRDVAIPYYYCGSEYNQYGSLLHELGHQAFERSDEYDDSKGEYIPENYISNVWYYEEYSIAESEAKKYNKNVHRINTESQVYWKICDSTCIMNNSGFTFHSYDDRCSDGVKGLILKRMGITLNKSENKFNSIDIINISEMNVGTFNPIFINDKRQIAIKIKFDNNEFILNKNYAIICPGIVPYFKGKSSNFYINYKDKDGESKGTYIINDPRLIRFYSDNDKHNTKELKSTTFDLLIPYDNSIVSVELVSKNKVVGKLDLNFEKYKQVFK